MVVGLIILDLILAVVLLNLYYHRETVKSIDKALKNIPWLNLPKEQYLKKSYDFIAQRFGKVNKCYLKYPWRNFFLSNMWSFKGKGLPCHMQNILFQRCLLKKFSKKEIKTTATHHVSKGIILHFYSKIKLNGKWVDVDCWGKKWGIPFGRNIRNSKLI